MDSPGEQIDFLSGAAVSGDVLAERLGRGPLPLHEAVRHAIAVGRILAAAHANGLVHGGLSPDCIAITPAGVRVLRPPEPGARVPAYPAPELRPSGPRDSLIDIYAFGGLLYEMMTGRNPFGGKGVEPGQAASERTLAWSGPDFSVPAGVQEIVTSLVAREPARRRQRIRNAVTELRLVERSLEGKTPPSPRRRTRRAARTVPPARSILTRRFVTGLALLALAGSALAAVVMLGNRAAAPPQIKFTVAPPETEAYIGGAALAPDGRQIVFSAIGSDAKRMLWLRSLDSLHAAPLPGTEGGAEPFWSPDGKSIGYFANASLRRIDVASQKSSTICSAEEPAGGGTWNRDGLIVFAPGIATGLYRVSSGGGIPSPLRELDAPQREQALLWPSFLPDGDHFLFFDRTEAPATTGVYAASLQNPAGRLLFRSTANAVFAPGAKADSPGYMLYRKGDILAAQPFDPLNLRLEGDPEMLVHDIGAIAGLSQIPVSVSNTGTLAYQSAGRKTRELRWKDCRGLQLGVAAGPGDYGVPRLSPDGSRIAVEKFGGGNQSEIYILGEGGALRVVAPASKDPHFPIWSPDGSSVLFGDSRENANGLFLIDLTPARIGPVPIFESAPEKYPTDWSRNARYLLFTASAPGDRRQVWALSVGAKLARPILNAGSGSNAAFSPDGEWIAYQSDESGSDNIYLQRFEGLWGSAAEGGRIPVDAGGLPRWGGDGKELYYMSPAGALKSVAIEIADGKPSLGAPRELFRTRQPAGTWNGFDVSPDGQRFIVSTPIEDLTSSPITVLTNWTARLND